MLSDVTTVDVFLQCLIFSVARSLASLQKMSEILACYVVVAMFLPWSMAVQQLVYRCHNKFRLAEVSCLSTVPDSYLSTVTLNILEILASIRDLTHLFIFLYFPRIPRGTSAPGWESLI